MLPPFRFAKGERATRRGSILDIQKLRKRAIFS